MLMTGITVGVNYTGSVKDNIFYCHFTSCVAYWIIRLDLASHFFFQSRMVKRENCWVIRTFYSLLFH